MPEFKKGPFSLLPNPPYEELALHNEVFQIWPSGEIFTNYEQYADRLYHYNQREWSCKYTGKGQLTFAEAYASEEKARKALDSFPEAWKGPLLAFLQHSFLSLDQICSQFMEFAKINYIPGEDIKIDFNGKRMNGKIISSTQQSSSDSNELSYRVEIFEDEGMSELVGEANVIGSSSFSRDRQFMTKTMIKRYAKSVSNRRGPNFPWFIPDDLAEKYGITTELPSGISWDMRPAPIISGGKNRTSSISNGGGKMNSENQMSIDEYFLNNGGFLADERSVSPPLPQFTFPCDDAVVPIEFIDSELNYPELVPMNQFIPSGDGQLTQSLAIWAFCQNFSSQLKLSPFPYDDWEEALTCVDPLLVDSNPIIEETFLALLAGFMKDRRSLTKGAYSDRLKSIVLTFKPSVYEEANDQDQDMEEANKESTTINLSTSTHSIDDVEITISSDDDEDSTFVKRTRKSKNEKDQASAKKAKSLLLPLIDLKKHRWYENRALEYWHFVLGSFLMEVIEMVELFIDEENIKAVAAQEESSSSSDESENSEMEVVDDSEYDEQEASEDKKIEAEAEEEEPFSTTAAVKQLASGAPILEVLESFVSIYNPIVKRLTGKGSKEMFSTFLALSLADKLALLEFLIHSHYDREAFKASTDDSLERQGESRRLRKEIEVELKEAQKELEVLEETIQGLKDQNAEMTERLEAGESDIELSEEESETENEVVDDDNESSKPQAPPPVFVPLSEKEREELVERRAGNKKEITGLNASCRRIRPEVTALQRKFDAASRDLRKCSSYRTFPLGIDRNLREYWWFGEISSPLPRLLVFEPLQQKWLGCLDSPESFTTLMDWLNPLGIREAKLKAALLEIEEDIMASLEARDLPVVVIKEEKLVASNSDSEEEVDFEVFKKARGRPIKGTGTGANNAKRPFQRYKNTL